MSTLKEIGFETGDLSQCFFTAGTPTAVTSPVHTGAYAAQLHTNGDTIGLLNGQTLATGSQRQWFQIDALPTGGDPRVYSIIGFWDGAASPALVHLNSTGHLIVESSLALTGTTTGTHTVSANTWYELSAAWDKAAGGVFKVWIRSRSQWVAGVPALLDVSVTHAVAGNNVTEFYGRNSVNSAVNLYIDEVSINDTLIPNPSPTFPHIHRQLVPTQRYNWC